MRAMHGVRAFRLLSVFGAFVAFATAANADTSSERPGSILIFPKVVRTATRDTVIQITNTGNLVNEVSCYYLDGDTCGGFDFTLNLTKQQPTHWRVGSGRAVNPVDAFASDGAGLDPGLIPVLPEEFAGALVCVETIDGVPTAQNKLKGEATLQDISGSANANDSKYNAIAISGATNTDPDGDGPLPGNDLDTNLELTGAEYGQCSTVHQVDVISPGVDDPVLGEDSSVITNITVVPCNLDFRRRRPTAFTVNTRVWNSFEVEISPNQGDFSCWGSFSLDFTNAPQTTFATVELTTPNVPVAMVVEQFVTDSNPAAGPTSASAARNVHLRSSAVGDATITLPPLLP